MHLFFYWALFFLTVALILVWSFRTGISPMPTGRKVKKKLFELLPLEAKGTIYELGAGWGTLLFPLADRFPRRQVVGYEVSPLPFLFCALFKKWGGYNNLKLLREDFFEADLSGAGIVVCYLYPAAMERLKEKFDKELPQGCLVISHTFAIPGWTPVKTVRVDDLYRTPIYCYRVS